MEHPINYKLWGELYITCMLVDYNIINYPVKFQLFNSACEPLQLDYVNNVASLVAVFYLQSAVKIMQI